MGKIRWQILVDEDLSKWYDDAIEDRKYGSRSQAGELALRRMKEEVGMGRCPTATLSSARKS